MEAQQIHQALGVIWAVVADANRYFAASAPWELRKTDPERFGTVLWTTAEVIRQVALLAQPFVPTSAAKLLDLLDIPAEARSLASLGDGRAPRGRHRAAGAGAGVPALCRTRGRASAA